MSVNLHYEQFASRIRNRIYVRVAILNDSWIVHLVVDGKDGYDHFVLKQDNQSPLGVPTTTLRHRPVQDLWHILSEWSEVSPLWVECTHEVVVAKINGHMHSGIGDGHPAVLQILAMALSELAHHEDAQLEYAVTMNKRLCYLVNNINMGAHQYGGNPIRPFRT